MLLKLLKNVMPFQKDGNEIGNGTPQESVEPRIKKGHRQAVVSFTLGMLSIFLVILFLGIPSLILAIVGLSRSMDAFILLPMTQRDGARAGFVVCVLGIIFSLIWLVYALCTLDHGIFPLNLGKMIRS